MVEDKPMIEELQQPRDAIDRVLAELGRLRPVIRAWRQDSARTVPIAPPAREDALAGKHPPPGCLPSPLLLLGPTVPESMAPSGKPIRTPPSPTILKQDRTSWSRAQAQAAAMRSSHGAAV